MSTEHRSSSPPSPLPHIDTATRVGEDTILSGLEGNTPNGNTTLAVTNTPLFASQSAPIQTTSPSDQLDKEPNTLDTPPSSSIDKSPRKRSSSPHPPVDPTVAVGKDTNFSKSEGNTTNDDTTQPSETKPRGSTTVPDNSTTPPSQDGNALNSRTLSPVMGTSTSTLQQPTSPVCGTIETSNDSPSEVDNHVMSPMSTRKSIAGQQPPTSHSSPRAKIVQKETAVSLKQSGSRSRSSHSRRLSADETSVQPRAPGESAQDFDQSHDQPDDRATPLMPKDDGSVRQQRLPTSLHSRLSSVSDTKPTRSLTPGNHEKHLKDTFLELTDGSWQQQPLFPHDSLSTPVEIPDTMKHSKFVGQSPSTKVPSESTPIGRGSRATLNRLVDPNLLPLSSARFKATRTQSNAFSKMENKPSHSIVLKPIQRKASNPHVHGTSTSGTATSSDNSRGVTQSTQTATQHHGKTHSWLEYWNSIVGSITLALVFIGVVFSGIGMTRSATAIQKSDESFRLSQWRNCIDLSVRRVDLRL